MPHLGIGVEHKDERIDISKTIAPNILSQSLSDVKVGGGGGQFTGGGISGSFGRAPSEIGRRGGLLGPQPGGIVSRVEAEFEKPTILKGVVNPRLALRPEEPITREGDFVPRRVIQELGLDQTPQNLRPGGFTETEVSKARGITRPEAITAPVLADIDFSSIEGLIKGVGSVAEFTQNLQKFNRSRGITPGGKGKKRGIKPSDIQNRIKFLQSRIDEGFATETEETGIIDELDILNQYMQSVLGVGRARVSETDRQSDLKTILAR